MVEINETMKVLVVLEFGRLHYREPLFDMIRENSQIEKLDVVTHDDDPRPFVLGPFKWLTKKIDFKAYDVVVYSFNLYRPIFLKTIFKKTPVSLFWGHGYSTRNNRKLILILRNFLIKKSNGLLLYTGENKSKIERLTGHENIQVLNNTLLVKNATGTGFDSTDKRLIYVGRIQERKRLDLVVEILELLNRGVDDVIKFRIVGEDLCSFKTRFPKEKYSFLEYYDSTYEEEELLEHFGKSWAYISPWQLGLGVNHSFAYGCPIVAIKDAKHGPEYLYCNDTNSFLSTHSELKNTIEQLFSNENDVRKKGERAFEFFTQNLTSQGFVNQFLKALKEANKKEKLN